MPFDRKLAADNDMVAIVAPYFREQFRFACRKGEIECNGPPAEFHGHKLGVEADSIPDFYLLGTAGGALARDVMHFPMGSDAVGAMIDGHVDGVLATHAQIEAMIAKRKATGIALRTMPLPAFPSPGWDIGMAVKENSRNLGDAIEGLLATMAQSGELKAIFGKYGVTYAPALAA